ncbi:unnamed protein product [Vicia faba]|uniref:Uncharacterized protein n=1 Tax=Vicia faba TaxID=3906 RepID=A0AAV0ZAB3_VICFA|nr:unnamed protein product [Vicia faba]
MSLNTSCLAVRGNDVAYCPIAHAFSIVTSTDFVLIYMDKQKVSIEAKTHLEENGIKIKDVNGKHQAGEESSNLIWVDPASCCYALYSKLNPDTVLLQQSPLALPKALKGHLLALQNFNHLQLNHGLMQVGYVNHPSISSFESSDHGHNLSVLMTGTIYATRNLLIGSNREFVGFNTDSDESVISLI